MKKLIVLAIFNFSLFTCLFSQNFTDLLDFNAYSSPLGENPEANLTIAGTKMYGMTNGAAASGWGNIFSMNTNGTGYNDILDFTSSSTSGAAPYGSLTLSNDTLYGMTHQGGLYSQGVIFSVDTDGTGFQDLFDLGAGTTAEYPDGTLLLVGNTLFGMGQQGGIYGQGCIFSIHKDGTHYRDLLDFNGQSFPQGSNPTGALLLVGTTFYGMAQSGGVNNFGCLFSVDTDGTGYADLVDFNGTSIPKGNGPHGSLIISGSTLYGMTQGGGANNHGCIFSVQTNGSMYTDLVDFNNNSAPLGAAPYGSLNLIGNTLYGMTFQGGNTGSGIMFSVKNDGTNYTVLVDFNSSSAPEGGNPAGDLVYSGGLFYGMTSTGGANSDGDIFTYSLFMANASIVHNVTCHGSSTGTATVSLTGGTTPFTYAWTPGGVSTDTASGLSAGAYTVTVTDALSNSTTASVTITQPTALQVTGHTNTDTVSVAVSGGMMPYTYVWTPGNATTDTVKGLSAGTYTCTVADSNGCSATTTATVVSTAGINTIASANRGIAIYPNPNSGNFIIAGLSQGEVIEIYNYVGQKISSLVVANSVTKVNLTNQAEGVYFMQVLDKNKTIISTQKVVKAN